MIFKLEPSCKVGNNSFESILEMIFFQRINFPFSTLHISRTLIPSVLFQDSLTEFDVAYNLTFIDDWY